MNADLPNVVPAVLDAPDLRKLEPARVGILMISEVLVSVASASVIAGEVLSPAEWIGGSLVLIAGVLEFLPERKRKPA